MKKKDVVIGRVYRAKVSGKMAAVRIDMESSMGGWSATNVKTKRNIHIRSAQRLRYELTEQNGRWLPKEIAKPQPEVTDGDH